MSATAIQMWEIKRGEKAMGDSLNLIQALIPYLKERQQVAKDLYRAKDEKQRDILNQYIAECNRRMNEILGLCASETAQF